MTKITVGFTELELRRIANRISRKPRNGQDIVIEAKCRRALDLMHPTGHCTCGGEGHCEWCRWRGDE